MGCGLVQKHIKPEGTQAVSVACFCFTTLSAMSMFIIHQSAVRSDTELQGHSGFLDVCLMQKWLVVMLLSLSETYAARHIRQIT